MTKLRLISTVLISSRRLLAGTLLDTVEDAATIAEVEALGGLLVVNTPFWDEATATALGAQASSGRAFQPTQRDRALYDAFLRYAAPLAQALRNLATDIILRGQSNIAALVPVAIGHSAMTQYLGPDLLGRSDASGSFVAVVDGSANMRANAGGGGTGAGPGLGQVGTLLCRRILEALGEGSKLYTYALAYPGQVIDYFLESSVTHAHYEDGSQHPSLNNRNLLLSQVQAAVAAGRPVPQLAIVCQGEADANVSRETYFPKIRSLFLDDRANYPGIKWLLIGTLGSTCGGVFAAQKQLAEEFPDEIYFLDNRDMQGNTAYWRADDTHYTTYAGYELVAERCFALLKGESFEKVDAVDDVIDLAPCQHRYRYIHSVSGSDVLVWQDSIGVKSLTGAKPFRHIAYDPLFGGRSCCEVDRENQEVMSVALDEDGPKWSVFMVGKLDSTTPTQTAWELFAGGDRFGLMLAGLANSEELFYDSAAQTFTGTPGYNLDVHSYVVAVDGPGLVARLYRDGYRVSQIAIDGSESLTNPTLFVGALAGAINHLEARLGEIDLFQGTAFDDDMAKAAHRYARVEWKLLQA